MTSGRPLFFVLVLLIVLSLFATSAFAADEKAQPQPAGAQNQTTDLHYFRGTAPVSRLQTCSSSKTGLGCPSPLLRDRQGLRS
jgi:hypothetical protein